MYSAKAIGIAYLLFIRTLPTDVFVKAWVLVRTAKTVTSLIDSVNMFMIKFMIDNLIIYHKVC